MTIFGFEITRIGKSVKDRFFLLENSAACTEKTFHDIAKIYDEFSEITEKRLKKLEDK